MISANERDLAQERRIGMHRCRGVAIGAVALDGTCRNCGHTQLLFDGLSERDCVHLVVANDKETRSASGHVRRSIGKLTEFFKRLA